MSGTGVADSQFQVGFVASDSMLIQSKCWQNIILSSHLVLNAQHVDVFLSHSRFRFFPPHILVYVVGPRSQQLRLHSQKKNARAIKHVHPTPSQHSNRSKIIFLKAVKNKCGIFNPITEPIGGTKPKFSLEYKSLTVLRQTQQNLALLCPAQASPLPAFRLVNKA